MWATRSLTRHRVISAPLILALAVTLHPYDAALAGTSNLEIVHPTLDICQLLSNRTAAALLGATSVATRTPDPAAQCQWVAVDASDASVAPSIELKIEWLGPTDVARLAQSPTFGITSANAQPVNDLPAKALWLGAERELVVLSGGMRMEIFMAGAWVGTDKTSDALRTRAVRAAREALQNLPP